MAVQKKDKPSGQIKKLYILYILDVLKRYTDFHHPLKQQEIIQKIKADYDVDIERKAVSRNIGDLCDLGFEIEKDGGYYLASREFEDAELRLLIDSVMASRYIPKTQAKRLIQKLMNQSNVYFKKQMKHISNLDNLSHEKNNLLFYNIEMLSEAIELKSKVRFFYNKYDWTKKLRPTKKEKHLVNPYQIVVANGKYYLIGNIDKYHNVTHFRIERISDLTLTKMPVKPMKKVEDLKGGLDLPKHMLEHIYMFSGTSSLITLRVNEKGISDVIDWLGKDIEIAKDSQKEGTYIVRVKANEMAMKYWAVQFGETVEVLEPLHVRNAVRASLEGILDKYTFSE